jgi:hypothetical protein
VYLPDPLIRGSLLPRAGAVGAEGPVPPQENAWDWMPTMSVSHILLPTLSRRTYAPVGMHAMCTEGEARLGGQT